jgi:hypothetical protein
MTKRQIAYADLIIEGKKTPTEAYAEAYGKSLDYAGWYGQDYLYKKSVRNYILDKLEQLDKSTLTSQRVLELVKLSADILGHELASF